MTCEYRKTEMDKTAITPSVLNKMFGRALMYGASWNYERMQNLGFLYMMVPALKKIYNNTPAMAEAMKRHLEFFNTHQSTAPFIGGVAAAMEESEGNEGGRAISGIKVGLMGPLAGIGDSLIWLTLVPICFSIGASYSAEGGLLGVFIALALINIINVPLKYFGLKFGYSRRLEVYSGKRRAWNAGYDHQHGDRIGIGSCWRSHSADGRHYVWLGVHAGRARH